MKCSNCGAELAGDFKFCPHCGHPVESGAKTADSESQEKWLSSMMTLRI